ncbi:MULTISPECIES: cutinase family protein [Mycobacteriaceae]|uniref:cutinase family protein n=1 Tax=Mycobacteriaceae TaxID=1762 RepID=UPI00037AE006|nr:MULTISPECIES: cutinase family protein [Mycobacteriaceae]KAB7760293.1 cutinase [Mycolicibacterium mucogenicum DSM 44124]SEA27736.1 cutinase [Mycobacterium sp. 283mftsu]
MKSYISIAVVAAACALSVADIPAPSASAAECPDIEVVFARGTTQPPGLGEVGQAFVDSLASHVGTRSVEAYAVDYPATWDFDTGMPAGSADASGHIQSVVTTCPKTRMVLGGYSQGAGVISMATAGMPPQIADHVAAVVLFGNLRSAYAATLMHAQLPTVGTAYTGKTLDLCLPDDLICSDGQDWGAHTAYVRTGMADQAAGFAASRL